MSEPWKRHLFWLCQALQGLSALLVHLWVYSTLEPELPAGARLSLATAGTMWHWSGVWSGFFVWDVRRGKGNVSEAENWEGTPKCFPRNDELPGWLLERGMTWGLSRAWWEERNEGWVVVEREKPGNWEWWAMGCQSGRCLPVPSLLRLSESCPCSFAWAEAGLILSREMGLGASLPSGWRFAWIILSTRLCATLALIGRKALSHLLRLAAVTQDLCCSSADLLSDSLPALPCWDLRASISCAEQRCWGKMQMSELAQIAWLWVQCWERRVSWWEWVAQSPLRCWFRRASNRGVWASWTLSERLPV